MENRSLARIRYVRLRVCFKDTVTLEDKFLGALRVCMDELQEVEFMHGETRYVINPYVLATFVMRNHDMVTEELPQ